MNEFNFAEADKAIRSTAKLEIGRPKRNMVLGWYGARLKEVDRWHEYGYSNEASYRDSTGISTATWGRYVRIAGQLPHLTLEDFVAISAENAEALGSLNEKDKLNFTWVFNARTMKSEDFKREVLKNKATAAGVEPKDMRVKFGMPLFEAQRKVIQDGIEEFSREHQIKDKGTALEWLVLEYSARNTFRKFLVANLPLLRAAHHGDKESLGVYIQAMSGMLENLKG